ncbi:hypothetical protein [Streptomyces sp. 769]|uniref:hypothetical protein n=1 Tax=Streptomyces sp. 769 TaxID=1262452 RepID=UPI00057FBCCE|nr:hypothetical protein [Streptomyces sp. 769]AJC53979.1 hypothetical protein GZL_01379 [Streptomyces sp. 769]
MIKMYVDLQMTPSEIARQTGLTPGGVQRALERAKVYEKTTTRSTGLLPWDVPTKRAQNRIAEGARVHIAVRDGKGDELSENQKAKYRVWLKNQETQIAIYEPDHERGWHWIPRLAGHGDMLIVWNNPERELTDDLRDLWTKDSKNEWHRS